MEIKITIEPSNIAPNLYAVVQHIPGQPAEVVLDEETLGDAQRMAEALQQAHTTMSVIQTKLRTPEQRTAFEHFVRFLHPNIQDEE